MRKSAFQLSRCRDNFSSLFLVVLLSFLIGCGGGGSDGNDPLPTPPPEDPNEKLREAEADYKNIIKTMAAETPDFVLRDIYTAHDIGDFLNEKNSFEYHSNQSVERDTYPFPAFRFDLTTRVNADYRNASPSVASLPALLFAKDESGSVESATWIDYHISFNDVHLDRLRAPSELVALDRQKAKDSNRIVYGVYKSNVEIRMSYLNESRQHIESKASFFSRMLNNDDNMDQSNSTRTEYEYVLKSVEPVSIGFLIKDIKLPSVQITQPKNQSYFKVGNAIFFSGHADDIEDGSLTGQDLRWMSSLSGEIGTGNPLVVENLALGKHRITLHATNQKEITGYDFIEVTVGKTSDPTATIISPANGVTFTEDDTIILVGEGTDPEDGSVDNNSIMWVSSIDGRIGMGTVHTLADVSPGVHVITESVTDSDQGMAADAITITVVKPSDPKVTITSPQNGTSFHKGKTIHFTGSATDLEDGPLAGDSLTWISTIDEILGTGGAINIDSLSVGTHKIFLVASDSDNAVGRNAITITVKEDNAPVAEIDEPVDGQTFKQGDTISFEGRGSDPEDGDLSGNDLEWLSSVDGRLGNGTAFHSNQLSLGRHVIHLVATDGPGAKGEDAITITVTSNEKPSAGIINPRPSEKFWSNTSIGFNGSGYDAEDGELFDSSLIWFSSRDGQIGNGATFSRNLSFGEHVITLLARDSRGLTESATVVIYVDAGDGGPTASISSPEDGVSFRSGEPVTLSGTGLDAKDGPLQGESLKWLSSVDGNIGQGTSFTVADLSQGAHKITLSATDSDGLTGIDFVQIKIKSDTPPEATITSPQNGKDFYPGDMITFTGKASDTKDGDLTGNSLAWISNQDGEIGKGMSFSRNDLSINTHIITLTATDSDQLTDSESVTIAITSNQPPVASISGPQNNSVILHGESVTFTGNGSDPEDGQLTGDALRWTSDKDGEIGTGNSFSTQNLSVGKHLITLTVTDGRQLSHQTRINIEITPPGCVPPMAEIVDPKDGSEFQKGESVRFVGSGTDDQDGNLSGGSLVWRSSINGEFGSGTELTVNSLSIGTHTITLTATDSDGCKGTDSITIVVNCAPGDIQPLVFEGEDGTGTGEVQTRLNASGIATMWLYKDDYVEFPFQLPCSANYWLHIRYSNDNYDYLEFEDIRVDLDGNQLGTFKTVDTEGAAPGDGWNIFCEKSMGPFAFAKGQRTLRLTALGGDGSGVEIDTVTLDLNSAQAPGTPGIELTQVPSIGTIGGYLKGRATVTDPHDYGVAVYIFVGGWFNKPYWETPLTPLQCSGDWDCPIDTDVGGADETATKVAAFLVPRSYSPELLDGGQQLPPSIYSNAVATTGEVDRAEQ